MKFFISLIILSGCMPTHTDSLDTITEEVIAKKQGVNIEITPENKKQ
jgi:hypothetical protein